MDGSDVLTSLRSFTNFTAHTSFGDIDTGLVGSSLVGFPAEKGEVFRAWSILQFLHVGIVDAQTKLVQLLLHILDDLGAALVIICSRPRCTLPSA
jgi:hypothetical protein